MFKTQPAPVTPSTPVTPMAPMAAVSPMPPAADTGTEPEQDPMIGTEACRAGVAPAHACIGPSVYPICAN